MDVKGFYLLLYSIAVKTLLLSPLKLLRGNLNNRVVIVKGVYLLLYSIAVKTLLLSPLKLFSGNLNIRG